MENTSKDTLIDSPFSEQVEFNLQMLQYRLDELKAIDTTKAENHQKYLMVFDSFIVLFRALLLEKGQSQYTIQHYFKELRNNSIDEKVNRFLDQPFYDGVYEDLSIRKCLKFIADKFVCHIDPVSSMDVGMANSMMSWLSNPFFYNNIINISTKLFEIINEDGKSYIMQSNTIESK